MKTLVIGAGGFVGKYLLERLSKTDGELFATKLPSEEISLKNADVTVKNLDITDVEAVFSLFEEIRPDCVFHLAAQSSAALSWKKPQLTININVIGALNLLEAVRSLQLKTRILLIGSGEEYGYVQPDDIPIKETTRVRPANVYAVSKLAQNLIGGLYSKAYKLDIISVRAFNHIGAGQSDVFVASDFCKQVAEIEAGKKDAVISVGNLSAKRDFTDVNDVISAYIAIMEKGISGKTYNVGGGTVCTISELLDRILKLSDVKINVEIDKSRLRPIDTPEISADISELVADTGFEPSIPLNTTLLGLLNHWRAFTKRS